MRREFDGAQGSRGRGAASPTGADVIREADRLDLARAPAGIIVDEAMAILQFRGDTGTYLSPASGAPTHRLLSMAREGLGPELCAALDEAQRLDAAVTRRGVRFKADDGWRHVDLKVEPIRMPHGDRRCHLIQFTDANGARGDRSKPRAERAAAAERELAVTKDYLQAIISDQQAVTEELETANEEILSSNEELQSTNEELLMVNDELAQRNREATLLSEHLTNLLTSVRIPILMLGRDLRIRRFTPPAGALLNLLETDVGRPITDIALRLRLSGFEQLLRGVIHTLVPTQRDVQDLEGRWHVLAIHPYRTLDDRIDGVVVSLTDVNEARISARRVANLQAYAESIVNSVSQPLVVLDASLRVRTVNVTSSESFGMPPSEAEGRSLTDLADWFPLPTELMDALGEIAGDGGSLDGHEVDLDLLGRGRRTLRMIEESVRSASDLCDRLLSYAGHRERVPMPCHLGALVMSASRLAQVGLGSSTRIQFDLAADLPPIRVDPTQIQQVLMNLILNAAAALRGHGTVLVIDDEASVRTITVKLLELLGFTAIGVASGREAVAMFREQGLRFRLVLLDLTMPGLGGEATFRELRALRSDVRVVLMSGYGQEDAVERLRMEGLVGFLPKPFGREQLTSLLLSVLGDD